MAKYFFERDKTGNFGDDYPTYWIVEQTFWREEQKCDDCFDDCPELPAGFGNSMESAWEFYGTVEQAEAALAANASFARDPGFTKFIDNGGFH